MAHARCFVCDDPLSDLDRLAMAERNSEQRIPAEDQECDENLLCAKCIDNQNSDAFERWSISNGGGGSSEGLLSQMREARRLK